VECCDLLTSYNSRWIIKVFYWVCILHEYVVDLTSNSRYVTMMNSFWSMYCCLEHSCSCPLSSRKLRKETCMYLCRGCFLKTVSCVELFFLDSFSFYHINGISICADTFSWPNFHYKLTLCMVNGSFLPIIFGFVYTVNQEE